MIKETLLVLFLSSSLFSFDKYDKKALDFLQIFKEASIMYEVDLKLLLAVSKAESHFDPKAENKNKDGSIDRGLMQINEWWRKELSKYTDGDVLQGLYEPEYNIKVGAWILKQCINSYGESWKAVDCYNKGAKKAQDNSTYVQVVWKNYQSIPPELLK